MVHCVGVSINDKTPHIFATVTSIYIFITQQTFKTLPAFNFE